MNMKEKDILEGLLGKFIYFELQSRARGYSNITKVDSVVLDEDSELPTHSKADGMGFGFHSFMLLCRSLIYSSTRVFDSSCRV